MERINDAPQGPSGGPQITAIEGNLFAFFSSIKAWPQIHVHDEPDILWTISDIPFPLFNSVLRANLVPDRVDDVIEVAIDRARSRNVPIMWWTGPATQPPDLDVRLRAKGFYTDEARGMALPLEALPKGPPQPSGLIVEQVTDVEALTTWCKVCCEGFEMPQFVGETLFDLNRHLGLAPDLPLRNYLGCLEGEPVATSSLFLGGGAAGVYNVTTLPRVRRRGIGAAITTAPLLDAIAEDYRIAILHATEMAVGVYRSLGFEEYCRIGQFVWMD